MPINRIAISFLIATLLAVVNKFFIGSFSEVAGDVWHAIYYTLNALAYAIPAFTILNYLSGWSKWAFTLVPSYYLEWAYSSYFYQGGVSCLDLLEMVLGVVIVALITNYKTIKAALSE